MTLLVNFILFIMMFVEGAAKLAMVFVYLVGYAITYPFRWAYWKLFHPEHFIEEKKKRFWGADVRD
jgi:hypothetical protein